MNFVHVFIRRSHIKTTFTNGTGSLWRVVSVKARILGGHMCQMQTWGDTEATVTGNTYQDMLENWLFPQLANDSNYYTFHQDGALPRFHRNVRGVYLVHPQRWIGRAAGEDSPPPHSPVANPALRHISI
jgi:hypothetical protein